MRQAAAAVEDPAIVLRQERPPGDRTGDALRALHDLRGDQIDELLREPPDGRRVSKQLMRVHI